MPSFYAVGETKQPISTLAETKIQMHLNELLVFCPFMKGYAIALSVLNFSNASKLTIGFFRV
jgi:hypothetical protein